MRFFTKYKMDHGGILYDSGNYITSNPMNRKLEASKRMNKDKTGRIFAAFTKPEEQALEQIIRDQK